jgi:hypothetical protein
MIDAVRVYDQSVHTCLRMLGLSNGLAGIGQILAFCTAAVCVWLVFARSGPGGARRRLVVLLCGLVFGAPHVGDYDHVLLAVACGLVWLDARPDSKRVWLAAAIWIATFFNPPALIAVLGVPVLTWLSALTPALTAWLMVSITRNRKHPDARGNVYGALHNV